MPGTGFLTVGAASALAFCQVLREEYPDLPCKLNQVRPTRLRLIIRLLYNLVAVELLMRSNQEQGDRGRPQCLYSI